MSSLICAAGSPEGSSTVTSCICTVMRWTGCAEVNGFAFIKKSFAFIRKRPRLADSILYCFSTGCAFLFIIDCILYIYVKAYIVHRLYILTMRQKTIKQKNHIPSPRYSFKTFIAIRRSSVICL